MPFPYSLVIFDLDGTLVDSAADIAEAVNLTLQHWQLPTFSNTQICNWIGEGSYKLIQTAFQQAGSQVAIDEVMPTFMQHYGDCLLHHVHLYPGVRETLQELQTRDVTMVICTNKPERFVQPILKALDIAHYFSAIIGGDTLAERKPSALPLLHLAKQLKHPIAQCLMVGDSHTDWLAAQTANMPIALVSYGYPRDFDLHKAKALLLMDDMQQLLKL